jgi:hypothetical protein
VSEGPSPCDDSWRLCLQYIAPRHVTGKWALAAVHKASRGRTTEWLTGPVTNGTYICVQKQVLEQAD